MSIGKVVFRTLAGLAISAIAGILLAPVKGSKTRKQMRENGEECVDELKSKFDETRGTLSEKFESAKNNAEDLAEKGKTKYEDAKKDVKNAAANFKHDGAADSKYATL